MSDVSLDWRFVSQHYIQELIAKAVDQHQLDLKFKPSLIVTAGEDALPVARMLKAILKGKGDPGSSILTLSSSLDLYDEEANPYNPSHGYWGNNSFSGHRILVVDKADNSRSSLALFLAKLQSHLDGQKATAVASGTPWTDPQTGVFVLHNKRRPKAADLPSEVVSNGRYFAAEECDNVAISYPFSVSKGDNPTHQSVAHGDHPHLGGGKRRSLEGYRRPRHNSSPGQQMAPLAPQDGTMRLVSSHYIEEIIERALEQQQVFERFKPTVLVAVCSDSLAPARMLRQLFRSRYGQQLPVLTYKLELYNEDLNLYSPIVGSWASTSLSGHRILLVKNATSTRATLSHYIEDLQRHIGSQRQAAQVTSASSPAAPSSASGPWEEPVLGIFVLHSKAHIQEALPAGLEGLSGDAGRYFVCENVGSDVHISYPFHVEPTNNGSAASIAN